MRLTAILNQIDLRLFLWIFDLNGKQFRDRFFTLISRSADGYWYFGVAVLVLLIDVQKGSLLIVGGSIAFLAELPIYYLLKTNIQRKRPYEVIGSIEFLVAPPDRFSFPSGHTAAAFVMSILLASLYQALFLPLIIWGSLVAFSRVYLGVHYPGDVLAGALIGSTCALMGIEVSAVFLG